MYSKVSLADAACASISEWVNNHGNLADHSRLGKELDGSIYRCPAHRRQLFTERLDCKAFTLLLQELDYRLPGRRGPLNHGSSVPP